MGPQVQDHHILEVAAWGVERRNPVGHHTLEDHRIPEAVPAWLQERRSRAVLHTGLAAPHSRKVHRSQQVHHIRVAPAENAVVVPFVHKIYHSTGGTDQCASPGSAASVHTPRTSLAPWTHLHSARDYARREEPSVHIVYRSMGATVQYEDP